MIIFKYTPLIKISQISVKFYCKYLKQMAWTNVLEGLEKAFNFVLIEMYELCGNKNKHASFTLT